MGINGDYKEMGIQIKCLSFEQIDSNQYPDEHFDWICIAEDQGGEQIAFGKYSEVGNYIVPYNVEVHRKYRRLGIASAMYKLIESTTGKEISPDEDQSADAVEFWKNRK